MHVSVSICHEMLNPVMFFNWCCEKLLGNYLLLFRNSVLKVINNGDTKVTVSKCK